MALSWDAVGSQTDVEVLAMVSLSRMLASESFGVAVRGSGTGTTNNSYILAVTPASGFQAIRTIGTAFSTLNTFGTTHNSARYYLRLRLSGTDLKARAWVVGETEPSTWNYEVVDTNHTSGWVGFYGNLSSNNAPRYCDFISVDAAGGTAPMPGATLASGQFAEDFSTQTVGTPSGFTPQWNTTAGTWDIVDETPGALPNELTRLWRSTTNSTYAVLDETGSTGGKVLSVGYGAIVRSAVVKVGQSDFADQEIVARVSANTLNATTTSAYRAAVSARTFGAAIGGANGYVFGLSHSTASPRRWRLNKYVNNASTILYQSANDAWDADTDYFIKIEVRGTQIQVRAWEVTDPEPSTWLATVTDTALTTGVPAIIKEFAGQSTSYDLTLGYGRWDTFSYQTPADSFGTLEGYLPPLGSELTGVAVTPISATLDANLPTLTAELTGTYSVVQDATLDASLPTLTAELEGRKQQDINAILGTDLPILSAELTGVFVAANLATLDADLPSLTGELTGLVDAPNFATLDASLPHLDSALTGLIVFVQTATLDAELPKLTAALNGFAYTPFFGGVPLAIEGQEVRVMRLSPMAQPAPQMRRRFGGMVSTISTGPGTSRFRGWNVTVGPFEEDQARTVIASFLTPGPKIADGFLVGSEPTDVYIENVQSNSSDIRDLVTIDFAMRERFGR